MIVKIFSITGPTVFMVGLTNMLSGVEPLGTTLAVFGALLLYAWFFSIVINAEGSFMTSKKTLEFFITLGFELFFSAILTIYYLISGRLDSVYEWLLYAGVAYGVGFLLLFISMLGFAIKKSSDLITD